jgi:UDP-xylose:glucoside alpha-1,3-xylosyltransferase
MKIGLKLAVTLSISLFIYTLIYVTISKHDSVKASVKRKEKLEIKIAVVVCGERVDESLAMFKSALLFSAPSTTLHFIVIAQHEEVQGVIREQLENLKIFRPTFAFTILEVQYPKGNEQTWIKLFKPCASERLFLPTLLPSTGSLIYVDCDVIFVSPPELLYRHFATFNEHQIAALTWESESSNTGWYTRFARHPFYGAYGVNSGVMLMNLTRMRQVKFEDEIVPIFEKFKDRLAWGDQDLINIYFNQYPERLHLIECAFNYRPDHCMYRQCPQHDDGIKVVHGNRESFSRKDSQQSVFRHIFRAIHEVR